MFLEQHSDYGFIYKKLFDAKNQKEWSVRKAYDLTIEKASWKRCLFSFIDILETKQIDV